MDDHARVAQALSKCGCTRDQLADILTIVAPLLESYRVMELISLVRKVPTQVPYGISQIGEQYPEALNQAQAAPSRSPKPLAPSPTPTTPSGSHYRDAIANSYDYQAAAAPKSLSTLAPPPSRPRTDFTCPFCQENGILKSIQRKPDLGRHLRDFHLKNVAWICQDPRCAAVFDFKAALSEHMKKRHGTSLQSPGPQATDHCQRDLCPKMVLGCGISHCKRVFEASGEAAAKKQVDDYIRHLSKHTDEDRTHQKWSYSTRMRNLLRQRPTDDAYVKALERHRKGHEQAIWDPETSSILRVMLETQHLGRVSELARYAVQLAFPEPGRVPAAPGGGTMISLKDQCPDHGSSSRQRGYETPTLTVPDVGQSPAALPNAMDVDTTPAAFGAFGFGSNPYMQSEAPWTSVATSGSYRYVSDPMIYTQGGLDEHQLPFYPSNSGVGSVSDYASGFQGTASPNEDMVKFDD